MLQLELLVIWIGLLSVVPLLMATPVGPNAVTTMVNVPGLSGFGVDGMLSWSFVTVGGGVGVGVGEGDGVGFGDLVGFGDGDGFGLLVGLVDGPAVGVALGDGLGEG